MERFRLIFFFFIFGISFPCLSSGFFYQADTLITVTGKITDKETKEPVLGKLFYEKLPYYDDMGIATSKIENGSYQLYMIKNITYNVKISAAGYDPIEQEMVIVEEDSLTMYKDFELSPNGSNDKVSLSNLIFTRGRAVISQSSYKELDEFAAWLQDHPDVKFRLDGHTDFQGNAEANMALSQERVNAVRDYLIKKGVKGSRVKTKAFGGSQPISRERTDEAKKANRRVEVTML
ncbi:OmpA family protein [Reichenbachiella sp. MALMAid0571]|uniref:OmpA family protein n=1 Tax=Reichenbachiella sp. MALMAid0571 TaxID=3143939 RepID=UPI0032DF69D6